MEQHVMVSQDTALFLCEREELTAGLHVPWLSSGAQPLEMWMEIMLGLRAVGLSSPKPGQDCS